MELELFTSTAEHWGEAIDCRCLSLTADFYSLSAQSAIELASDIIVWLSDITTKRFWVRRCVGQRSVRQDRVIQKLREEMQARNFAFYTEEAMAVSPVVYNLKTYQDYLRKSYIHGSPAIRSDVSVDYPDVWNALFPENDTDPQRIRENILKIFREEGRIHKGGFYMPDASISLKILPYRNQPGGYYGAVGIHFSSFGLNSQRDDLAEHFAEFAEYLSQTYRNLNIQVALQPRSVCKSCYMEVFGTGGYIDGSHIENNCLKTEWYPSYYLPGVEWYNSISPLTQQHLCHAPAHTSFHVQNMTCGNLAVKSLKPISEFDISDGLEMKKWLQPALIPGMSSIPLRTLFYDRIAKDSMSVFPRSTWAVVPVFEEEIAVLPNYLTFDSKMERW